MWNNIKKLIGFCVSWGIGYAGMWAAKWVIADLTLHTGTIKDAIWSIIGRTEAIGGRPRMNGGVYVIGLNLQEYPAYMGVAAGVLAVVAVGLIVMMIVTGKWKEAYAQLLPVVITAAMDHCRTASFRAACEIYFPNSKCCCCGCSHHFYRFDCKAGKKEQKI